MSGRNYLLVYVRMSDTTPELVLWYKDCPFIRVVYVDLLYYMISCRKYQAYKASRSSSTPPQAPLFVYRACTIIVQRQRPNYCTVHGCNVA
jgi:hypothetical protein